jgi:tRNA (guanine10-N2)-dimethyltransferase
LESFFLILSGEHPTLPQAEIRAILEANAYPFESLSVGPSLLRIQTTLEAARRVGERSLTFNFVAKEIFVTEPTEESVKFALRGADLSAHVSPEDTFCVRIRSEKGTHNGRGLISEASVGKIIAERRGAKVNLTNPKVVLVGTAGRSMFLFGRVVAARRRRSVSDRLPRRRPMFHPATMQPKLARIMVNLSRPPYGGIFLDPFCGVGGLLLEAGLIGCRVIGLDVRRRMIVGARRNLRAFGIGQFNLTVGDARALPFREADSVAGDPPYGREASTGGAGTEQIVVEALRAIAERLGKVRHVCFALPQTIKVQHVAEKTGFSVKENHSIRVHRSLTRQIVTFSR